MGAWPLPARTLPAGPCNGIWNTQNAQHSSAELRPRLQMQPENSSAGCWSKHSAAIYHLELAGVGLFWEGVGLKCTELFLKHSFFLIKPCCEEIKIACWGEQTNCGGIPKIPCVKGKVWMHVLKKKCVAFALLCFHYSAVCWLLGSINTLSFVLISHWVSG